MDSQIAIMERKLDNLIALMNESNNRARTARIVEAIVADIQDREGLGDEWVAINPDVRAEIRTKWTAIVNNKVGTRVRLE
jgi:hypothetical protein